MAAFLGVLQWSLSDEAAKLGVHEVERGVKERMMEVQRLVIQGNVSLRGCGNVILLTHRKPADRDLRTEFGLVEVQRLAYSQRGHARLCPIEASLQLPLRSYSYEVQRHLVLESVRGPYQEAVDTMQRYTGLKVAKLTCEEVLKGSAVDFDEFYAARTPPDTLKTANILVGTLDCKGIPVRRCVFHAKPNADSAACRTRIPLDAEHGFRSMANADSAACRMTNPLHAEWRFRRQAE